MLTKNMRLLIISNKYQNFIIFKNIYNYYNKLNVINLHIDKKVISMNYNLILNAKIKFRK